MENVQNLDSQLVTEISAAEQAVFYFESMQKANAAIGELIQHQVDFAKNVLSELNAKQEKNEI